MTDSRRSCFNAIVVICALAAGGCAGKRVASSFAELQPRLKVGQHVHVTTIDGDVRKGRLENLSRGGARVTISGASIQMPEGEIAQITVREPLWQGIIIGGLTGAALGSVGQQATDSIDCFYGATNCDSGTPVRGMLIGAGIGSAIGAGIDALFSKRKRVYAAPGGTPARVVLSPITRKRTAGVRLSVIF